MKKNLFSVIILIFSVFIFTGCAAKEERSEQDYVVYETAAAACEEAVYDYGYDLYEIPEPTEYKTASAASGAMGANGYVSTENVVPEQSERKLIRTIDITLQTEKFDEVTAALTADVASFGGYIENSSYYMGSYSQQSDRNASITVRIPADKADQFLSKVYPGTYVTNKSEYTEDVSLQYSDLETRLSTLETERTRLTELIKEAEDVDSIIALEQRLSEIRYEVDSIHNSLKSYDNRITYTTVWFYIYEVQKAEPSVEAGFGERIANGFERSTKALGTWLTDFAVWFVSNIVTIILVLALIFGAVMIVKAVVKNSKRKAAVNKCEKTSYDTASDKEDENPEVKNEVDEEKYE